MSKRFATTDDHVKAFSEQQRERFVVEVAAYLRKEYAAVVRRRDDEWLRELIRVGIEAAREYGIVLERDVARYVELMLALSPNFDDNRETSWCKDILTQRSLTAEGKLDRIYERIMFGQERETAQHTGRAVPAPRPFNRVAVPRADDRFRVEQADVDPGRLTMEGEDDEHRQTWMAAYHQALDDLKVPPATSRPHAEVGAPVVDRPEPPTGNLVITLVDADSDEAIAGASVQVSGPAIEQAVSDYAGEARFEKITTGEYAVLAMDARHRLGQGQATVERGNTQVRLACRQVNVPP